MILFLSVVAAWAEPRLVVEATVDADLRHVRGTVTVHDLDDAAWVDPLADLPMPPDALEESRTFPGRPDTGSVTVTPGNGTFAFTTRLPRRWGDVGATDHGLFANGAWLPQPLVDGTLPVVAWDVTVHLPDGTTGVLGDVAGTGTLRWTGAAERASLAVLPGGRITRWRGEGYDVTLVTRRRPRPALRNQLAAQLPLAVVEGRTWEAVVVEAPLRRRLARPGVGVLYLSDRSWRVFPWFHRLHHRAVIRGLLTAAARRPDPFERAVVGAAAARAHAERARRALEVDLLGLTKWIPVVDAALYSTEMPYQAALFDRPVPTDPVRDDLVERYAPHAPGFVVATQLADRFGEAVADRVGDRVALGWPLDVAVQDLGVPEGWLDAWRVPYPEQDYQLALDGTRLTVTRVTHAEAPPETVVLSVDGTRTLWTAPAGPSTTTLELPESPRRVALDPARHTGQTSRAGDVRPAPLRWTLGGRISGVNISERFAEAYALLSVRGAADTHNRFTALVLTNQREWLAGRLAWTYNFGPELQPAIRKHAVTFGVDGSWLNRAFAATPDRAVGTAGGTVAYRYEDRVGLLFPRRGGRVGVAISAGGAPGAGLEYFRVTAGAEGEASPHPAHAFAFRANTGFAATELPSERLAFGGGSGVRGIADAAVQTTLQGVGAVEYRVLPIRQASIPLGLLWVRDLKLAFGVDAGVGDGGDTVVGAVGAAATVGVIVDNLGMSPGALDVTVGTPLWTRGFEVGGGPVPLEVYLVWGASF